MASLTEIKDMIDSAEAALKNAKKMLIELSEDDYSEGGMHRSTGAPAGAENASKVIEGAFNGERMIAPDGENYPVPANYASKSKLVAGDHLKLSILDDGRFVYKQIGPVPRKTLIGTLVYDDGQYRVMAEGKSFKVLLASVTYYKGQIGDKITIIVPEAEDTDWAAIEAVLPRDVSELNITEDEPEEEVEVDF